MPNPIWGFLTSAFQPIADIIDNVHSSDEEMAQLSNELFKLQSAMSVKILDYESQLLESKTSIIVAEAQSQSWIARNWRPITMLTFLFLVVMDSFGLLSTPLAPEAWTLLQLGLSGYVVGRSAEKILPKVIDAMKKNG